LALKREFLSTNEVAQVLGLTPFTIRRYIQLRKLKAVKLMGSYRVRQTDLEQFLKAREIETEEELEAQAIEEHRVSLPRRRPNPVEKKSAGRSTSRSKLNPKPRARRRQPEEV
jgi:excisionase family DNA binding protein